RIVNALLITDETMAITAEIEQLVPVGTIARQARDIVGEDDADLPEGDARDQLLKAWTPGRAAAGESQVGIDDRDAPRGPAGLTRTLTQRVLQVQTFSVIHHLSWTRLPDIDQGLPAQVM